MKEQPVIHADNNLLPSEDFHFLRKEGIKLIERLAGKLWTDYNTHDPGITILEALCYALTDLGYRTSFDIKDILANSQNETGIDSFFYTARQVLFTTPVTLTDYRKLIIDTEGVKNAWVEISNDYEILLYLNAAQEGTNSAAYELAYEASGNSVPIRIRGLYKILVEYEEKIINGQKQKEMVDRIRKKLQVHRNLCEDFISISSVEYELFSMEAEIQVNEGANVEKINAQVLHLVQSLFSPSVPFYTLDQMLERGYSIEEIYEGPSLKHGFIDTKELERSDRSPEIHLSDIVNRILKIEGVIAVKKCLFPVGSQTAFSDFTEWIKEETMGQEKVLRLDVDNSVVRFTRSGDRHRQGGDTQPDKERVKAIYSFLLSEKEATRLKDPVLDVAVPAGEDMNIGDYYPFQFNLPSSYGLAEQVIRIEEGNVTFRDREIGEVHSYINNLSNRKKQVLQLRGYLMVFEQIMADYLSQLANIRKLFSFAPDLQQTYFRGEVKDIPDIPFLLMRPEEERIIAENETVFFNRRNAVLDHLLARFGEEMNKFSFYVQNASGDTASVLKAKSAFLKDYIQVSNYRGAGFDYTDTTGAWNTDNVAGVKKRIFRLLGIENYHTKNSTCNWIDIEKRESSNNLSRYAAVVRDPGNNESILLESNPYETESEARHILKYILQEGHNKSQYKLDGRTGKYAYGLTMKNTEGVWETIGGSAAANKGELDNRFNKLLDALQEFTLQENLHLIEHILLRPKIDPLQNPKGGEATESDAVALLSVINTASLPSMENKERREFPYKFKLLRRKTNDQFSWKLSLLKNERVETLSVEEMFLLRKNATERIIRIRQAGADKSNYLVSQNADGYSGFSIMDGERVLAASKYYRKKEDMDAEIESLVAFFSFELNLLKQEEEDDEADLSSYADPYSFQVSFFIPDWPARFRDPSFRHLLEKAIYMEVPAHIRPEIYWLDYKQMKDFETVYRPWLQEMAQHEIPDTAAVNHLVAVINELRKTN